MDRVDPRIPAGFMELLPAEQIEFNRMLDIIRQTYELYGFLPIETPALEYASVLLAKAGGETEKQIYRFERGNKEYCLHFDLTVPLARYVATHYHDLTFPFRRYQLQKVWRAERPQRGRFREFYQCDIDVIGTTDIVTDAEIVSVIDAVFSALGFERFTIRINNRKVLNGYLDHLGLSSVSQEVLRSIDKLEKRGQDTVSKELQELGVGEKDIESLYRFLAITGPPAETIGTLRSMDISNETFVQGLTELESVVEGIQLFGVPETHYTVDLTIARGLDYYTGTVYETVLDDHLAIGSICSGGRYDNLADYYTNISLPGVGASIGLTRLFDQLKTAGVLSIDASTVAKVLVVPIEPQHLPQALKVAAAFRQASIPTEVSTSGKKLGAQLKYADKLQFPFVAIVGMDEAGADEVAIKNMAASSQAIMSMDQARRAILGD